MWKCLREKVDAQNPRTKEKWVEAIRHILDNDPDMEYTVTKKKIRRSKNTSIDDIKEEYPQIDCISPHPEISTLSFNDCFLNYNVP